MRGERVGEGCGNSDREAINQDVSAETRKRAHRVSNPVAILTFIVGISVYTSANDNTLGNMSNLNLFWRYTRHSFATRVPVGGWFP